MINNEVQISKAKEAQRLLAEEMVNLVKSDPTFPIVLRDGVERRMEFGYFAVKEIFKKTGININAGNLDTIDLSNPDTMALVILTGLKEVPENLDCMSWTQEDVEKRMLFKHFAYYAYCVRMGMEAAQPDYALINRVFGDLKPEEANGKVPLPVEMPLQTSGPPVEFN